MIFKNKPINFNAKDFIEKILFEIFGCYEASIVVDHFFISVQSDNFFLLSHDQYYWVAQSDYEAVSDRCVQHNKVVVGRLIHKKPGKLSDPNEFTKKRRLLKKILLQQESIVLTESMLMIYDYLRLRISENNPIVNHGAVQSALSEVFQYIEELKIIIDADHFCTPSIVYAEKLIRYASTMLAKLQGGYGFLTGGMLEMHYFFQLINKIYLLGFE